MSCTASSSSTFSAGTFHHGRLTRISDFGRVDRVALLFDFLNGMHDAANSIATIVSTRVLRPQYAVAWAAFFNFIAFLFFGLHVANTLGTGIIAPDIVDPHVIFGALMGAILWNVITWRLGIPSSSSHALIGGLVGAGTRQSRSRCDRLERPGADHRGHHRLAVVRLCARAVADADTVVVAAAPHPLHGRSLLQEPAIRVRLAVLARPRRQRRAEDHGHHRRTALFARAISGPSFTSRSGWSSPARPRWAWARWPAAGAS